MILASLIILPAIGALAVAILGRRDARVAHLLALGTALLEGIIAIQATRSLLAAPDHVLAERALQAGVWRLSFDGLSAPLVLLTAVLTVVSVLVSLRIARSPASFLALLLALEAAVVAVFLAADVVLFYVAWEAVLIPMFFLIGIWGHERRKHAAMKFFLYTFAGSALMLAGLIIAATASGGTAFATVIGHVPAGVEPAVLGLLLAGFLVKIPAWPLHTWLPDAHVEAPTAGSIMLAGVLLKMGGYGLMRLAIPVAPHAFERTAWLLAALGAIGIVYGALMALAQKDLKRLVAYSSVSHMGFVLVALSTGSALGASAAMLVMVSHGLVAGLLFLLVGALQDRTSTRAIADLGGLGTSMPAWATAFTFAALAGLGLPGLSGFPGEFATVLSSWSALPWAAVLAAFGALLAAAYSLRAVAGVAWGPLPTRWTGLSDIRPDEALAVGTLGVAIVALGVAPGLLVSLAEPAIRTMLAAFGGG